MPRKKVQASKTSKPVPLTASQKLMSEEKRLEQQMSGFPPHIVQGVKDGMKRRAQTGVTSDSVFNSFFSPFRTRTSVEQPTKRKDLNEWYRFYFKHHPTVGTALELHTEFPLSGFHLEHEDKQVEQFFNDIKEDLNLEEFVLKAGLEYWVVGEFFPFTFVDDVNDPTRWDQIILLDPDYIKINTHPFVRGDKNFVISLKPDADLKKIVNNGPNSKETGDLFKSLPADIIDAVKSNKDIMLPQVQVSHVKRSHNPFNVRGESVIARVIHTLMYEAKLKDAQYCLPPETEVLTERGFIKIPEVTLEDKVATFNKNTEEIEFHNPRGCPSFDYDGEMYHFKNRRVDFTCTPNHRMLVQKSTGEWVVNQAKEVTHHSYKVRLNGNWVGKNDIDHVMVDNHPIPIEKYLKFAGWYVSEGMVSSEDREGRYNKKVPYTTKTMELCQVDSGKYFKDYNEDLDATGIKWYKYDHLHNKETGVQVRVHKTAAEDSKIAEHFEKEFGTGSYNKKVPSWIKQLTPDLLQIFINSLVMGDGTVHTRKDGILYASYPSASKQLIDDVMEIVWKAGYTPVLGEDITQERKYGKKFYCINWACEKVVSRFPHLWSKSKKRPWLTKEQYKGKVYCLEVPNYFFVTRQNGRMAIHGNTIADRHISPHEFYMIGEPGDPADQLEIENFRSLLAQTYTNPNQAIIWHHALRVQWEGANGRILPLQPEFDQIQRDLMNGLGISEAFLNGTGPTYANASVALDVLIGRYIVFREKMENWLRSAIFAPICKMHGIYKKSNAELDHRFKIKNDREKYDLPKVIWTKTNLRDDNQKIALYERLVEKNFIPADMLLKLVNINPNVAKQGLKREREEKLKDPLKSLGLPAAPPVPTPEMPLPQELPALPEGINEIPVAEGEGLPGGGIEEGPLTTGNEPSGPGGVPEAGRPIELPNG